MNLEDNVLKIKSNEHTRGDDNLFFFLLVGNSDIIYEPIDDEEYNLRHRLECLIFSAVNHVGVVEFYYPEYFEEIKKGTFNLLKSLIEKSDPIKEFSVLDFIIILEERYKFYLEEVSKLSTMGHNLPLKLLWLIYDYPLLKNIRDLNYIMEYDFEEKKDQLSKLFKLFKYTKSPIDFFIEHKKRMNHSKF